MIGSAANERVFHASQSPSYGDFIVKHRFRPPSFPVAGELQYLRDGCPRQPRIRWDLQSPTTIPVFGKKFRAAAPTLQNGALFRVLGDRRRQPTFDRKGSDDERALCRPHHRSFRNYAVLRVTPQRNEKLTGQSHDHHLRHPPPRSAHTRIEPYRKFALGLEPPPEPASSTIKARTRRLPSSANALFAFHFAARDAVPVSRRRRRVLVDCETPGRKPPEPKSVALSTPIPRKPTRSRIMRSFSSSGAFSSSP